MATIVTDPGPEPPMDLEKGSITHLLLLARVSILRNLPASLEIRRLKASVEGNLRHQPLVELSQLNPECPDDPKRKLPSFERLVDALAVGEKGILVEIALKTTLCMQVALNPPENPLSTLSRLFWKGMKKSKFWIVYH